jgi:hypothetical protein
MSPYYVMMIWNFFPNGEISLYLATLVNLVRFEL